MRPLREILISIMVTCCAAERGTIGAVLGQRADGRVFLRDVPPGLAADRAALKPGDQLLLIEGRDVRQMSALEIHRSLSGHIGAPVKLTWLREERVVRVTLRRTPAALPNPRGSAQR